MKTLKNLSIVLLAMTTLSCSKEDEQNPINQRWVVSKEHITTGDMQNTAVYIYNDKRKPVQIKFYDYQNTLLNTENYTYDANNFLIKWERDEANPNNSDGRFEITNDAQGRRILEKYYSNNVLSYYYENTFSTNKITVVTKNYNGNITSTTIINTDSKGNYLDYTTVDNDSNTPNTSAIFSNYDNKQPAPRWRYFEALLPQEALPNNPGRVIRKSGSTVTKDMRFEYQYNAEGYVTVIKKYNNLDNILLSTSTFDLIMQ